jgi:excisionase family DNA binding protein
MTQATTDDDLLNTKEAADKLGISRRHLYNLIYAGQIETIRIPSVNGNDGEHRIEPAEIERFKDRHRQRATA